MANYCLTADVQKKIINTTFSGTSDPTTTQVDSYCDEINDDMNEKFRTWGITLPVSDVDKLTMLRRIACFGVLAMVYRSIDMETDKAKMYQALYDKEMSRIEKNPAILNTSAVTQTAPSHTFGDRPEDKIPVKREEQNW